MLSFVEALVEGEGSALEWVASGGWGSFSGLATAATQKSLFHKQKLFGGEFFKPNGQHGA